MKTHLTFLPAYMAASLCTVIATNTDQALLAYSHCGDRSAYGKVEVTIHSSGKANVLIRKHSDAQLTYQTTLSPLEMEALDTLIASTGFFSLTSGNTVSAADVGQTEITILREATSKTVSFGFEPTLQPLCSYLLRLCIQAQAITSIESDTDVYTATGAVNSNHAGGKALQPDRLREPLVAYVKRSKNTQRIRWALEALGWIMTPDELLGLLAGELKKNDRQALILDSMSGNLSKAHLAALCPLYLSFIRDNLSRRSELTSMQKNAFDGFLAALGHERYEPAIPLFTKLFDQSTQPSLHPDVIPLARMGTAGLCAVMPYLDSANEIHRSYAIELFQIAARGNPRSKYSNPYSTWEYAQMIPLFNDRIIVRLKEMQEKDPSLGVRAKAETALTEIVAEIAK